jgi:hypothetical protein
MLNRDTSTSQFSAFHGIPVIGSSSFDFKYRIGKWFFAGIINECEIWFVDDEGRNEYFFPVEIYFISRHFKGIYSSPVFLPNQSSLLINLIFFRSRRLSNNSISFSGFGFLGPLGANASMMN